MSIPTEISGTILNSQTWYVSNSGSYANKLVFQSTSATKHYYLGSNLHNDGTDRSANEIYFDTSDNKWHDSGNSNPVSFRVGSVGSETPAESSLPTSETNTGFASDVVNSGDNVIIYRGSSLQQIFQFTQPSGFYSGTYSGTITRHARSVTFPLSNDFVYRNPDLSAGRLEFEKYDSKKFRVSWFDQNEPAAGYNATLKWYSSGSQVSISQQITADAGDITWQVDTNTPGWPIDHESDVTLHFDVNVVVSGASAITAGDAIKTFTYLGWGPFTGTFTKQKVRPGDTISWEIRDTNPYPDYTGYTVSIEQEDGTSTDFQLLSTNAIPYGVAGSFATADDSEGVARLWEANIAHRTAPHHILAECVVKKFGKVFSNFW